MLIGPSRIAGWGAFAPRAVDKHAFLVEYRGEDPTIAIKPLHRTTEQQARAALEAVGFRWVETKRFLPMQHILIFEPTE